MKASISAEDDQYIGVDVTDNQQVEHDLTLKKKTDEIVFHDQDGYADKAVERTNEGGKHVGNARRYAQWYVYRQRGYDTMPALENPDRVTLVALVVSAMDTGPFEEYFGDLYQQLRSHSTDVEPIVPIPDLDDDETLVYQQDVYLGIDQEALDALADDLSVETVVPVLNDLLNWSGETGTSLLEQMDRSSEVVQEHGLDAAGPDLPPGEWIEAVSGIHRYWGNFYHEERREADQPAVDRDPDARLEIVEYEPGSIADFQEYVVKHLRCQIRDCYLRMGKTPPEPVRVTGPGINQYTMWYQLFDTYQNYWDPDAEIAWTIEPADHTGLDTEK